MTNSAASPGAADSRQGGSAPRLAPLPALSLDKRHETRRESATFARVRAAEVQYGRQLRGVARHVGSIVAGLFTPEGTPEWENIELALRQYSTLIGNWARATARRMLTDVARRDEAVWAMLGREMARGLREEIRDAPTGEAMRQLMETQVSLITSLPLEAARRVHEFAIRSRESGARAREIAAEVARTGPVTASRAMLIARTEVARASSVLVEARAMHVGSEGYIWRSVEDPDVRPIHRRLNGTYHRWDDPPVSGERGERSHPGAIFNCRCFPDPVFPKEPLT